MWLMSRLYLLILLFLMPLLTFSQEEDQKMRFSKEVKINSNFRSREKVYQFGELAPVFILETHRKIRHEFEISKIGVSIDNQPIMNNRDRLYLLGLRYQYTYPILKGRAFLPYVAAGLQSVWNFQRFPSRGLNSYESYRNKHDNIVEIIPGLRIPFSEKMGLDISFVFPIIQHYFQYDEVDNPYLSIQQSRRAFHELYFQPFWQFHSRLGFFVKH